MAWDWANRNPVNNPHPAILTYARCKMMKWNHLPQAGGTNDQDPRLLAYFDILYEEECKAEQRRQEKEKAEAERKSKSSGRRVAGR